MDPRARRDGDRGLAIRPDAARSRLDAKLLEAANLLESRSAEAAAKLLLSKRSLAGLESVAGDLQASD